MNLMYMYIVDKENNESVYKQDTDYSLVPYGFNRDMMK